MASESAEQIKQMIGFIEQEALEKVIEIDERAEEEFNLEKNRLVRQQTKKIMEFFERKEKEVQTKKKVQHSTMLNKARLVLLKAQEDHLLNVIEEAQTRLSNIPADDYRKLLTMLVTQGLFQLLEKNVIIRCRRQDISLVEEAIPSAISMYKAATKMDCQAKIDSNTYLGPTSFGGVELIGLEGRITVKNTLSARLELIHHQMIPHMRAKLFGQNPNRKFLN